MINQDILNLFFSLVKSALTGVKLTEDKRGFCNKDNIQEMLVLSKKHDISHLFVQGLNINSLLVKEDKSLSYEIIKAMYRYEKINYGYEEVCAALETAKIPFIPLKGPIIRELYPEPWMRTSCDIDIYVQNENLGRAVNYLTENYRYKAQKRGSHDISLYTNSGNHIELHFDLTEEGRYAQNGARKILSTVWDNAKIKTGYNYFHEMPDEYFYFYHIAHMAKHFETGGCGIRPFIDLWILDSVEDADKNSRDELLKKGGLFKFAEVSRKLSKCWFQNESLDEVAQVLQNYILTGGVYGTSQNRVAIQQEQKGGKIGYMFSRIFVSYDKLKRYYPILEKYRWLMPIMQVRRWSLLFRPDVARMAKREMGSNKKLDKNEAEEMGVFLSKIGL